jgi:hypothetical protein
MAAHIVPCGAGDAQHVDPPVGLEALVFNGDDGLTQHRRKIIVVDDLAPLQRKRADDASLLVVENGGGGGAVTLQVVNLRQIGGVDRVRPASEPVITASSSSAASVNLPASLRRCGDGSGSSR